MSEASKVLQRRGSLTSKRGIPSVSKGPSSGDRVISSQGYSRNFVSCNTGKVLSELPKNQIKGKSRALKSGQSLSNTDLSKEATGVNLKEKILSCENVSRVVKNSKIPRATCPRKVISEPSNRGSKHESRTVSRPEWLAVAIGISCKENVKRLSSDPGTSSDKEISLYPRSPDEIDYQKLLFAKSDSCESKRSSDSLVGISDDEIVDISGDIKIRKEALDIAVKLATRTPTDTEVSSTLGFAELEMLDILGSSDLNLNATKNELSFTIFEDMDHISDSSNAVDRSVLIEDMVMPRQESHSAVPEIDAAASARSPSPMEEPPLSSRTSNAPVSIITSVTSIMSLDTGYQGDGELSRPESRSAEVDSRLKMPLMESGAQVKCSQFDDSKTMTDSDFFTESDADIHDDLSAAAAEIGSGKGDRKAQVIDGTLYGGVNMHKQGFTTGENDCRSDAVNPPLVSNCSNDDMASSGIFSDMEKKPEEGFPEAENPSPRERSLEHSEASHEFSEEEPKTKLETIEGMVKSSSAESSSTVQEVASSDTRTSPNTNIRDRDGTQNWNKNSTFKSKMPNRNVTSKVKVLIESSKGKTEVKPKTVRKGKWDAVMDRIAQSKEENKYAPGRFRDVKSKVYQNAKPLFSSKSEDTDNKTLTNNLQSKIRSRRSVRIRSSDCPLTSVKASRREGSPNSSQRSSNSDISVTVQKQKIVINDSTQNGIPNKPTTGTITSITTNNNNVNSNKHKAKAIKMVQKKSSPLPTRSKDSVQQKNGVLHIRPEDKIAGLMKQLKHNCKAFESLAVLLGYCISDLDAFSTPKLKEKLEKEKIKCLELESRLVEVEHHLHGQLMNKNQIINYLDNENKTIIDRNIELTSLAEDLKRQRGDLMDQLNAVEEKLTMKEKEMEDIEEQYKMENKELIYRIEEANKLHSMMKKLYDKAKLELTATKENNAKLDARQKKDHLLDNGNGECGKSGNSDIIPDRLESEIESLRQVLALKTEEISELRRQELILRENSDRVPKLMSTITLLEGKVEDFQTQLSSHIEANRELEKRNSGLEEELKLTNVQKLRLTQKNEELQYKLRQYAEALRQLVNEKNLTEDDIRNAYLYPKTPQKGDCSDIVDSLPAQMKGVVEKSDSVSYMLEMTEDSSEIVTNIVRRAESMRYASRSQTLPKKRRPKTYSVGSMDALSPYSNCVSETSEKLSSNTTKFPFHRDSDTEVPQKLQSKAVKLHPSDFVPDSIDLAGDDQCEIIEITKNFDETQKSEDLLNESSCSCCSSPSENENNFDIESDIYPNVMELEEERTDEFGDRDEGLTHFTEDDVSVFVGDGQTASSEDTYGKVPQTSGGEALMVSTYDTQIGET